MIKFFGGVIAGAVTLAVAFWVWVVRTVHHGHQTQEEEQKP